MKNAKRMFKHLGYERLSKKYNPNMIIYEKKEMNPGVQIIRITFDLTDNKVQFTPGYRYSAEEIDAVYKQLEELI